MTERKLAAFLPDLGGKRVMIVEDEYLLAADLARFLDQAGALVIGPFPTVHEALDHLSLDPTPDFAMLDVNLRGDMVFAVADFLIAAGIPFLFITGYDTGVLPPAYAAMPRLEKPIDL
ncbi:response regulator [Paracoccus sp. IB05]|uniref:response regulator n=1 Tax=Paracoccus sp. IB05 TaxID=2779367 RepID=UPI0018E81EDD|nr:response regulator [Paracoccus sp. IB05]MBJ2149807.1 response regulator [Paracoccus sp. IB05]